MIVDTSAIMSILINEPGWEPFGDAISHGGVHRISAGTWIELSAVLTRRKDPALRDRLVTLIDEFGLVITAMSVSQAELGHTAYREFGRGSGHPARLNFGDCFAYALARETDEPLLFKGNDFSQTDVRGAL